MRRLLSIDGGGIRGILPATVLAAMADNGALGGFDLVAGNSTGGIIACGIAAGIAPSALLSLYTDHGPEVFSRNAVLASGLFKSKYTADPLEKRLQAALGTKRLSDIPGSPELLVPSYCVELPVADDGDGDGIIEGAASLFFRSWIARADRTADWPLWQVARATSAAPTYFSPAVINGGYRMVDGGVFANNPAMCALAAAWTLWPGEPIKLLSLGTGTKVSPIKAGDWGAAQWAQNIASVMMDGSADAVSYQCRAILGSNFLRIDTPLTGVDDAFDNAGASNIADLRKLAGTVSDQSLPKILEFLK